MHLSKPAVVVQLLASSLVIATPVKRQSATTVQSAGGYNYLGCASDPNQNGYSGRALVDNSTDISAMTVEYCASYCGASGYNYFGLEYYEQCYCGNVLQQGTTIEADNSNCNLPCNGNQAEYCGGNWHLNLYGLPSASSSSGSSTISSSSSTSAVAAITSSTISSSSSTSAVAATTSSTSTSVAASTPAPATSTTASTTTSSTTSSASSTATYAGTLSCPASNGTTFTTGSETFQVQCYVDHNGGDMSNIQTSSFDDCLTACASYSGCTDVSWVPGFPGTCYLKTSVTAGVSNSAVWGAVLVSGSSSTTSTASSSSVVSTPSSSSTASTSSTSSVASTSSSSSVGSSSTSTVASTPSSSSAPSTSSSSKVSSTSTSSLSSSTSSSTSVSITKSSSSSTSSVAPSTTSTTSTTSTSSKSSGSSTSSVVPSTTTTSTTSAVSSTTSKSTSSTSSTSTSTSSTLTTITTKTSTSTTSTTTSASRTSCTSTTSSAPTTTATATSTFFSLASCPTLSVTMGSLIPLNYNFVPYYSGSGYTENAVNPSNLLPSLLPAHTYTISGSNNACQAAQACLANIKAQSFPYFSMDLHYLTTTSSWECTAYAGFNVLPSFFNVPNSAVSKAFGFAGVLALF